MQISISSVEDIHAAQIVLNFHLLNCPQHLRQALARYGGIHTHIIRADTPGGGKGVLAAAPKFETLRLIAAHLKAGCSRGLQDLFHARDLFLYFFWSAIALAQ